MVIGQTEARIMEPHHFHFIDLGHLFEKILKAWGCHEVVQGGRCPDPPAFLPLERMVTLTGALNGILVVRSTREFALWLRNQRENTALGRYPEDEVFEELISLFSLYLFHDFWRPHLFQIGPIHPFISLPVDWPAGPPTASSSLLVETHGVELRLWLDPLPDR